ncbi:MFS transporter [Psychromarinibacter halotolerans]|uniref:MFS transporter n=1 Tax=Psychromarinibacter halotolerans TaxID=1775175 RepID=A0ABV7GTW5_9RHOB|nr:MFS transporter [Psychromarinibacter halotolerans]MDF0594703.1 MFS transporter [Psychromarinibacter halotolerans]
MRRGERLSLYICLTALTAFAIDGILPVMPVIEAALPPSAPFTGAQIITVFILGMSLGELFIGPLSDAVGRRPAVIFGLAVFIAGTVLAGWADSFGLVILGRFLQGVGVAGPKIGTRAMVRDRHAGADMARVMSIVFTLIVLVPMIAPAIGAGIAAVAGWRGVFHTYLALAVALGAWLWLRHPETLDTNRRVPLRPLRLARNIWSVVRRRDVFPVVVATGFVYGAQLAYLAVAADLLGVGYDRAAMMPAFFALLASGTGAALLLNVRVVARVGMGPLILWGFGLLGASGVSLLIAADLSGGLPPLAVLIGLAWVGFFALGLLFGNLNAYAMRPLGDLAGLGSSIVASVSSLMSVVFVTAIERTVSGPVQVIGWGFALAAVLSVGCMLAAVPSGSGARVLRALGLRG